VRALTATSDSLVRRSVAELVPYEPGKPVEEVQRELGLKRVVKLASNEGTFPPFPAAREAIEQASREPNRYPDSGSYLLRRALAERHDVPFEHVAVGSGADGVIDCLCQAVLDPGDEVVFGWPSFPTYMIDARKLGAVARTAPLRGHTYDLDGLLAQVTSRTKLVYLCLPNNPTGTTNTRVEVDAYLDRVPGHVLTVVDQAYFEYVEDAQYPDALEEYARAGRRVLVLRTFSKIFGLAGLRVGYGVGPAFVVRAIDKVRRAFDVSSPAQAAALASLDDPAEVARRRAAIAAGRAELEQILRSHGLEPAAGAVANFVYAEVGADSRPFFERLLAQGVIVRPLHGFGAPNAIRVTVGTREEHEFLDAALSRATG
jgi:histidinol-phosphate aminotransferase